MTQHLSAQIDRAASWIVESEHPVVFTGAGISTSSGLAGSPEIEPNPAHFGLVELEDLGKLDFLVSQNIDNLHLSSGISPDRLAELHGNMQLLRCLECDSQFSYMEAGWRRGLWGEGYRTQPARKGQPRCPGCRGRLASSVINFGDPLPEKELTLSLAHASQCDLFFAIGSSLVVSPANEMPEIALQAGARLILLNQGETPFDDDAHLRIWGDVIEVVPAIVERVQQLLGTPTFPHNEVREARLRD